MNLKIVHKAKFVRHLAYNKQTAEHAIAYLYHNVFAQCIPCLRFCECTHCYT